MLGASLRTVRTWDAPAGAKRRRVPLCLCATRPARLPGRCARVPWAPAGLVWDAALHNELGASACAARWPPDKGLGSLARPTPLRALWCRLCPVPPRGCECTAGPQGTGGQRGPFSGVTTEPLGESEDREPCQGHDEGECLQAAGMGTGPEALGWEPRSNTRQEALSQQTRPFVGRRLISKPREISAF